jgi:L-aspartate oxidase
MSRHVGVLRDANSLQAAADVMVAVAAKAAAESPASRRSWEATNLLTVATAIVAAAAARTESRGCHRRTDFAEPRDVWLTHLDVRLDDSAIGVAVDGVPPTA